MNGLSLSHFRVNYKHIKHRRLARQGRFRGAPTTDPAALIASGLALPARRITVNLAPADLPKDGSHYDLPIALGLMAAIGAIPSDALSGFTVLGELGLDGSIAAVAGVPSRRDRRECAQRGTDLSCRLRRGGGLASPDIQIVAANSLIQIANHLKGTQVLSRPQPDSRTQGNAAGSSRYQGTGERQACAEDARRRWTSSVDDRLSRQRQIDACGAPAIDPSAAVTGRAAGSIDDRVGGWRNRRRSAHRAAAISRAASFRQHGGAGGRRHTGQTG